MSIFKAASAVLLSLLGAATLCAQAVSPAGVAHGNSAAQPTTGFALNEAFEGSVSASAGVLDLNSTAGYDFNGHFGLAAGVPVYFLLPKAQPGVASNTTGLGDAYLNIHTDFDLGPVSWDSTLTGAFPAGSRTKGLSSGRVMLDWDNRFDHTWGRVTPYIDIDPGNGIDNLTNPHEHHATPSRPFITYGPEVQIEAGADVRIAARLTVTGSAYDVAPWGGQTVYSQVLQHGQVGKGATKHGRVFETSPTTSGGAALDRDEGVNLIAHVKVNTVFEISGGYSRSIAYAENTLSFSLGFNLSRLLRHSRAN